LNFQGNIRFETTPGSYEAMIHHEDSLLINFLSDLLEIDILSIKESLLIRSFLTEGNEMKKIQTAENALLAKNHFCEVNYH